MQERHRAHLSSSDPSMPKEGSPTDGHRYPGRHRVLGVVAPMVHCPQAASGKSNGTMASSVAM